MLSELRISNFALIDHLSLEFFPGFQVLTGETGAGKSLLVDAITLLVGGRAMTDQIRAGAEEAFVEGVFVLPLQSPLRQRLIELDLLAQNEQELILRRTITRSGRNRLYLNGTAISLHQAQELGACLLDIHGQHEHQALLSSTAQRDTVDAFGQLLPLRENMKRAYDEWRRLSQECGDLKQRVAEQHQREELLRYQFQELEQAQLRNGEEEELLQEHRRLQHGERLLTVAARAYETLYGMETSVVSQLGDIHRALNELSRIDSHCASWLELSESALAQLQELARLLGQYQHQLEYDPQRLAALDERLATIQRLKKKYGESLPGLIHRMAHLAQQLEQITHEEERLADLEKAVIQAERRVQTLATQLSSQRRQVAQQLERQVRRELEALKMEGVQFCVHVTPLQEVGPTGQDQIEFFFSANPGEPMQPLRRVASGGELSRLMLAVKTVLAEVDRVPVVIFDEIDVGIGGTVATVMGKRLRALSQYHQVLCLTHLPQIASQATHHFFIEKRLVDGRMQTKVKLLSGEDRKQEIARMFGSQTMTPSLQQTASEMLRDLR
ncbi:MAG: DNA repair protein RecN [Nitrospirae bacterium]|nr:MAG: DNA repair protein RecN [Nitrospirota bacterium]